MEHFFTYIDIENFKSIKKLRIDGCKRINLFIGPPNVGKSNIIEALSIFSLPYFRFQTPKKINNFIRLNYPAELFYNANIQEKAYIRSQKTQIEIKYNKSLGFTELSYGDFNFIKLIDHIKFDNKLYLRNGSVLSNNKYLPAVKKYAFNINTKYNRANINELVPPYGNNIANVIESDRSIYDIINKYFEDSNMYLSIDKYTESIKFIKEINNKEVLIFSFNLIADTLQRMILFKTAILSNQNSILLFEEPEANCYPPYISTFADDMFKSKTNQFFVATHSPFIVNELLEETRDDSELAIYIVYWKDNQTQVKLLSNEEMNEVYQHGIDLFFNNDLFLVRDGE